MINKILFSVLILSNILLSQNNLAKETSPYLLQHKDNPVNWYAWGNEAFAEAKKQNKLIFLSIGYSTCHWCHVMAEESFEDKKLAKLLNKYFISIKVDKEQYPHIDNHYQEIYRFMNQKSGGWPLSIFLTNDKKVFYSATYIPKNDSYGQIGFTNLINKISTIPKKEILKIANLINEDFKKQKQQNNIIVKQDNKLALNIIDDIKANYDFKYNGFDKSRKFPQANKIILLLKLYEITKNKDALDMATKTLTTMAKSGIFDQIDGGFYRYTVDEKWKIPHFEKMLYTNAELIQAYSLAYKITKKNLYKDIVNKTINEIDKRFKIKDVYKSASNADSKNEHNVNEEGVYFLISYDEALEYLEKHGYKENIAIKHLKYLGINESGNFSEDLSNSILNRKIKVNNINKTIKLLSKLREQKVYPFIDEKINTSWNSLYINAKLDASIINKKYKKEALKSLDKLISKMYINNELYHQTIKDLIPTQKALLEDYSFLAQAVFKAYQLSLDKKYFDLFEKLVIQSIDKFYKNNKWRESQDNFITYSNFQSSSYSNYLAINMINIINYASLKAKTKIYKIANDTLNNSSYNINTYPSYYPMASLATLMKQYEPVFIKSNKNKLEMIKNTNLEYPFVYFYEDKESGDLYLACKINTCFSFSKDFSKIKIDIENLF